MQIGSPQKVTVIGRVNEKEKTKSLNTSKMLSISNANILYLSLLLGFL